jgi:hypothetical protein
MKTKPQDWGSLPRQSKLAACLYPDLVPKNIQDEMKTLSGSEGKRSPLDARAETQEARVRSQWMKWK